MSPLEELVRETLAAQEAQSPAGATLLEEVRRRSRRRRTAHWGVTGAAAAVTVAVVGVLAVSLPVTTTGESPGTGIAGPGTSRGYAEPATFPLPSDGWKPGELSLDGLATGAFHAARRDGQVCAWIGPGFRPVLWPQGYRVRLQPEQLIAPGGRVVAEAGDVISAAGGGDAAPPGTPCAKTGQFTWSVMSVPHRVRAAGVGP